jgi:hypothetical protein
MVFTHMNVYLLRPVLVSDYEELLSLETSPDLLHSWRLRGGIPKDAQAYEIGLWAGVSDQRIIEAPDGSLVGLAQLYNVDLRFGTGWFSVMLRSDVRGKGGPFLPAGLFINRCFQTWGLRRLYFSVLAPNWEHFSSVVHRPGGAHYGTLRDRTWMNGELVDVHICGIDVELWMQHSGGKVQRWAARNHPAAN